MWLRYNGVFDLSRRSGIIIASGRTFRLPYMDKNAGVHPLSQKKGILPAPEPQNRLYEKNPDGLGRAGSVPVPCWSFHLGSRSLFRSGIFLFVSLFAFYDLITDGWTPRPFRFRKNNTDSPSPVAPSLGSTHWQVLALFQSAIRNPRLPFFVSER